MKTLTKILTVATAVAGVIVQFAPVIQAWITAHPGIFAGGGAAAIIAALRHNPTS